MPEVDGLTYDDNSPFVPMFVIVEPVSTSMSSCGWTDLTECSQKDDCENITHGPNGACSMRNVCVGDSWVVVHQDWTL
jgi:hypothetical protein